MTFLENFANTANKALNDLAGVAVNNLGNVVADKIGSKPSQALPAPNTAPAGQAVTVPFYRQTWFLPVAIGAGILFAVLYVFRGK